MAPPSVLVASARPAEELLSLKHLGPQNLIQQQEEEARRAFASFAAQGPSSSVRCATVGAPLQVYESDGKNV